MVKQVSVLPVMLLALSAAVSARTLQQYPDLRKNFISAEDSYSLGGFLPFNPEEQAVNVVLMAAKTAELAKGFKHPSKFPPARNFLDAKKDIEKSAVFNIIQCMPKGGVLHAHSSALASEEYIFKNITYRENLYSCQKSGKLVLHFFDQPNTDCDWVLLSELRKDPATAAYINERIHRELSMYDPLKSNHEYQDGNAAWDKFQGIFEFLYSFMNYAPVLKDYFYQALHELYNDNVLYLEVRAGLSAAYELDGTKYSPVTVARIYREVARMFVKDHPKFVGVKLIYAPGKTTDVEKFDSYLRTAVDLKTSLPDFFVGFDLVGQEDNSSPLYKWIGKLQSIQPEIPFFFHAGETNWSGIQSDQNLIDAVLLKSKRIGHGYALIKHPVIAKKARLENIAIEICPISNQVLHLVGDMRNHPASTLFAKNYPVVISNDDPGLWGVSGLSYDFYEAFMGIMSARADIRALKQLAINSIKYSSLTGEEKHRAFIIWRKAWDEFVSSNDSLKNSCNNSISRSHVNDFDNETV